MTLHHQLNGITPESLRGLTSTGYTMSVAGACPGVLKGGVQYLLVP